MSNHIYRKILKKVHEGDLYVYSRNPQDYTIFYSDNSWEHYDKLDRFAMSGKWVIRNRRLHISWSEPHYATHNPVFQLVSNYNHKMDLVAELEAEAAVHEALYGE